MRIILPQITTWILFLCSIASARSQVTIAPAPTAWMQIPAAKEARSWKDERPLHLAWARRVMIDPFITRTKDASWHAEALRFVESTVELWVDQFDDRSVLAMDDEGRSLLETVEKLRRDGCRDPLVLYFGAHAANQGLDDFEAARTLFRELWPALLTDRSPAGFRRHVAIEYASLNRTAGRKFEEQDQAALEWTRLALTDGSFGPEDGEVFLQQFLERDHSEFCRRQAETLVPLFQDAKLPAWAADCALGYVEIDRAWNARGTGFAPSVTPEGWRDFARHLALARTALTRAWKARPDRPEAAAGMITVAMGESDSLEVMGEWFQRAVKARFDFHPIYTRVVQPLRPRWGGSHEHMLALAQACLATERFDTAVPLMAAMILESIAGDLDDWRGFYRQPQIAALLMTLTEAVAAEPSRKPERRLRQSYLAVNGWMTGDYARAAKALEQIGPRLSAPARTKLFKYYRDTEANFASELRLLIGPHRALFEKAETAYAQRDRRAARASFQKLAERGGAEAQPRARSRLAVLEFEEKLAGGNWVAFPIDKDLHGWQPAVGDWSANDNGLILRGHGNRAWIAFGAQIGEGVELRADISAEAPEKADLGLGFTFGVSLPVTNSGWTTARLYRDKESPDRLLAEFGNGFYSLRDGPARNVEYRGAHRLEAVWHEGRVVGKVDGEPFGEYAAMRPRRAGEEGGDQIGLACLDIDRGVVLRIKNFAARRLAK